MDAGVEQLVSQVQALVGQIEAERHLHLAGDLKARLAQAGLDDLGSLSLLEHHVVACIGESSSTNAVGVARRLRLTRGGVSKILARLEARGCVKSAPAADSKREMRYALTEKGEAVFRIHADLHAQTTRSLAQALGAYSPSQRKVVSRFLEDLKELV